MTVKITFNTARQYSPDGQVITAAWDDETMTMRFSDHTRMIDGEYVVESLPFGERRYFVNPDDSPMIYRIVRHVMRRYDRGDYVSTSKTLEPSPHVKLCVF